MANGYGYGSVSSDGDREGQAGLCHDVNKGHQEMRCNRQEGGCCEPQYTATWCRRGRLNGSGVYRVRGTRGVRFVCREAGICLCTRMLAKDAKSECLCMNPFLMPFSPFPVMAFTVASPAPFLILQEKREERRRILKHVDHRTADGGADAKEKVGHIIGGL